MRKVLEFSLKEMGFYPFLKSLTSAVSCEKENCKNSREAVVSPFYLVVYTWN